MSKFTAVSQIIKPGTAPIPPGGITPGGDDWLSRINTTIVNFRELLKAVQEARGIRADMQPPGDPGPLQLQGNIPTPPSNPGINKAMVIKFLDMAVERYGDKTIGELIELASPITLKQIRELIKGA